MQEFVFPYYSFNGVDQTVPREIRVEAETFEEAWEQFCKELLSDSS